MGRARRPFMPVRTTWPAPASTSTLAVGCGRQYSAVFDVMRGSAFRADARVVPAVQYRANLTAFPALLNSYTLPVGTSRGLSVWDPRQAPPLPPFAEAQGIRIEFARRRASIPTSRFPADRGPGWRVSTSPRARAPFAGDAYHARRCRVPKTLREATVARATRRCGASLSATTWSIIVHASEVERRSTTSASPTGNCAAVRASRCPVPSGSSPVDFSVYASATRRRRAARGLARRRAAAQAQS